MGGRRIEEFFFPSFPHPSSPTGMSQWLQPCCWSSLGWARQGVSRDGVSLATPGDDLCLLWRAGVGDRSQRGQSQIPALTHHSPLRRLPPVWVTWVAQGAHPHGVARGQHEPEGVFNKLFAGICCTAAARAVPTSRKQAAAPAFGSTPGRGTPGQLPHLGTHSAGGPVHP